MNNKRAFETKMKIFSLLLASFLAIASLHTSYADDDTQYAVINNAIGTPGGDRFDKQIGNHNGVYYLRFASSSFFGFLWQEEADQKNITSITLTIESMRGISNNIGSYIYMNSDYIGNFSGNLEAEFAGITFHEVARVRQWNGNGQAPIGLLTGIADFIRLKGGYVPANWAQPGQGLRWDEGYDVTARFLDYCNSKKAFFVGELNAMMRNGYSEEFFEQISGHTVDELWNDYKTQYGG